jgi:hypothetical protein
MIELKKDGLTYYSEHVEYILSMLDVDPIPIYPENK